MTTTCLRAAWWWIMPVDEANQVLEKRLSGKNKDTDEQGLLDCSIGSGLYSQSKEAAGRQLLEGMQAGQMTQIAALMEQRGSRGAMTWIVVGKRRRNWRHQVTGWATQRMKLSFYTLSLRHVMCWKSDIRVIHVLTSVQREVLCQQHSCAYRLCRKHQAKKRQPGSESEDYQTALQPALHIEESTWPHC